MLSAQASFQTKQGSQYLQRLCRHFAHKVEACYDASSGQVEFEMGQAHLAAFSDRIEFVARANTPERLKQTQRVLESHFIRFAFRENAEKLDWSACSRDPHRDNRASAKPK